MKRKWIFADWKLPVQKDLDLVKEVGFTDAVLGVVLPKTNEFKPSYSNSRIVTTAQTLTDLGVRVHLMAWAYRQKTYIRECARWIINICADTGAASCLLDAEGNWHRGYGVSAEVAALLVKQEFAGLPCDLGVTGLSNLHKTVKPLLAVCDYGLGQAYSIWKPGTTNHWSHSKATEPGKQQLTSWASWSEGGKPLVMGLSNYWAARPVRFGNIPKMGPQQSLLLALDGAQKAGADEVAYWSLKWLHGRSASRQIAREVLAGIRIDSTEISVPRSMNRPSAVQWLLVELGYNLGKYGPEKNGVDGSWGKKSQAALDEFRKEHNSDASGEYTMEDLIALVNALRTQH